MSEWNNVVGHEWAVQMLSSAIAHDRVGHAYLITGPEQIGKTTLALTFAQALNCREADAPCGQCRTCQLIANGRHPDVRLLQPEVSGRGKQTLKIEAIRQLQQALLLSAYEAKVKVAILRQFDTATDGAANAFLKTLEEPPANVVLILTANDADTLLPTIASRCRTVNLRPLPTPLIEQSLGTRWRVPQTQATLLAHLADGRLGWAVQAGENTAVLNDRQQHLAQLYEALNGQRVARFKLADKLTRKPEALPDVLKSWLSWWRDAMLLAQQPDPQAAQVALTNLDENGRLRELAARWTKEETLASLKQTNLALWQLERNANARLVIENLLLVYPLPE